MRNEQFVALQAFEEAALLQPAEGFRVALVYLAVKDAVAAKDKSSRVAEGPGVGGPYHLVRKRSKKPRTAMRTRERVLRPAMIAAPRIWNATLPAPGSMYMMRLGKRSVQFRHNHNLRDEMFPRQPRRRQGPLDAQ